MRKLQLSALKRIRKSKENLEGLLTRVPTLIYIYAFTIILINRMINQACFTPILLYFFILFQI